MAIALAPLTGLNAPLTAERFMKIVEAGEFGGARVELLDALVHTKIPQNRLHIAALALLDDALRGDLPSGLRLLIQTTIRVDEANVPEPDLVVAEYDPRTASRAPVAEDLRLVVEVSVATLKSDRTVKALLYAEAGIPEYWIVNPVARQVEIRRDPAAGGYRPLIVYGETGSEAPLFRPDAPIGFKAIWPALDPDPGIP